MKKYQKNQKILQRQEGDNKYLLFNPYNRKIVMLSGELFDIWNNIYSVCTKMEKGEISECSYNRIMHFFKNNDLVIEDD